MTSKKRDDFGRFTAENPKTILMRVTKAEKLLIYRNRLREFFNRDLNRFKSEEDVNSAARKVYSSLNDREIKTLDVFEIYFDVLKDYIESNVSQSQITSFVVRPFSYELQFSFRLPWSRRYFHKKLSWKWDRTIRMIITDVIIHSVSKNIQIKSYQFGFDGNNQLYITVDLDLNFPKQLENSFKQLANSDKPENYLFGITHKGIIFPISVNRILSGNYNILLISQAFRPMNLEILDMIEKEEYGAFFRISKANLNDLEENPRYCTEALLDAILQEKRLRFVDCFLFAHLDSLKIQQFASEINWDPQLDRMQSSSKDSTQEIFLLESKALENYLVLNEIDVPIKRYSPEIKNKKILVSGYGMPGVTSVTTVLCTNQTLIDQPNVTIDYERHTLRIRETTISVFDLGPQTAFLDRFTGELSEFIFSGVNTLIFVIDASALQDLPRVKHYLEKEIDCLKKYSPSAAFYVFINKIDLIPKKKEEEVIESIKTYLNKDRTLLEPNQWFAVSCRNETILKALDIVFQDLIQLLFPDMSYTTFKQELLLLSRSSDFKPVY